MFLLYPLRPGLSSEPDIKTAAHQNRRQLVEKVAFACEAGVCNPFFASALPRQKTLLSAQVCGLSAKPTNRARGADVRRKSHFSDFFDGLTAAHQNRRESFKPEASRRTGRTSRRASLRFRSMYRTRKRSSLPAERERAGAQAWESARERAQAWESAWEQAQAREPAREQAQAREPARERAQAREPA